MHAILVTFFTFLTVGATNAAPKATSALDEPDELFAFTLIPHGVLEFTAKVHDVALEVSLYVDGSLKPNIKVHVKEVAVPLGYHEPLIEPLVSLTERPVTGVTVGVWGAT